MEDLDSAVDSSRTHLIPDSEPKLEIKSCGVLSAGSPMFDLSVFVAWQDAHGIGV